MTYFKANGLMAMVVMAQGMKLWTCLVRILRLYNAAFALILSICRIERNKNTSNPIKDLIIRHTNDILRLKTSTREAKSKSENRFKVFDQIKMKINSKSVISLIYRAV